MWRFILLAGLLCSMSGCVSTAIYNKLKQKIGANDSPAPPSVERTEPS